MKRFLLGHGTFANSIAGKMAVVVLYAIVLAFCLLLLFLLLPINPHLLKFVLLAMLGLGSGFMARRLLNGYMRFLQWLTALVAVIAALSFLNPLSYGFLGINSFQYFPSQPYWDGLLQLIVCAAAAWLAIFAWSRSPLGAPGGLPSLERFQSIRPRVSPPRAPLVATTRSRPRLKPARMGRVRTSQPRARVSSQPRLMESVRTSFVKWRAHTQRQLRSVLAAPQSWFRGRASASKVKARPRKRAATRRGNARALQLSQVVEHRCPYCLEIVTARDPRGIKVCEVCGTQHHADCWEVAGVCQVPHLNS
jgi:ribosomal protein L37AE/L43A